MDKRERLDIPALLIASGKTRSPTPRRCMLLWDLAMESWSSSFSSVMDLLVESDLGPRHASTLSSNKEQGALENERSGDLGK